MPELRLITFGGLRLLWGDQDLTASVPAKAVALMVYLARQNKPQSREHLAELFWPERTAEQAYGSLRTALSKTRALVGDALQIEHQSIGVTAWLDANQFEVFAQDDFSLQGALTLYHGEFMASFFTRDACDFESWMLRESEQLHERFVQAGLRHLHQLRAQKAFEQAVLVAHRILTHAPLREDVHRLLIHLYHEMGEQACALQQYETCRRLLWEELGVEPDASTQEVLRDLKNTPAYIFPTLNMSQKRLPIRAANFIGRADVLKAIEDLLLSSRLLTLSATGGAGKTRLALELAYRLKDRFKDGVFFVDLTQTTRAEEVLATIAQTLGISLTPLSEGLAALQRSLQGRNILLILDNFEHVIEAANAVAGLIEVSEVVILVTSREPLKLYGERIYRLNPLTLEESCQLFRERVRDSDPHFRRTTRSDDLIETLCTHLEGLPLAIELAAHRARTMDLEEVLRGLSSRLDLLQSDLRNRSRRQLTLFYTIDWSYQLLTPQQASLLRTLAVFQGGWTAQALKQISPYAEQLADLVDKNLVNRLGFGFQRYSLQESVRGFARLQLTAHEEAAHVQLTHARWVMALVEGCEQDLRTPRHAQALAQILDEQENIRAALDVLSGQPEHLELYARIISAASWSLTVQQARISLMEDARYAVSQAHKLSQLLRAKLLCAAGHCADWVGEYQIADLWQTEALHIFQDLGDSDNAAYARFYLSGRTVPESEFFAELEILRTHAFSRGDEFLVCLIDTNLSVSMIRGGQLAASEIILSEGIAIAERNGFTILLGALYINLADTYMDTLRSAEAFRVLEQGLRLSQAQGNRYLEAFCVFGLCQLSYLENQPAKFERFVRDVEPLVIDSGNPFMWAQLYFWQSVAALTREEYAKVNDYCRLSLHELNPDNGNMQSLLITLLIYVAYRLSSDGHLAAAAQLISGVTAYASLSQASYNRLQKLFYDRTLSAIETDRPGLDLDSARLKGAIMTIQDLLSFAQTALVVI